MSKSARTQIPVTNGKGQWATVVAVVNPSSTADDAEPELVYGLGGLTVDKISEHEFRDFQGTVWTADSATSRR